VGEDGLVSTFVGQYYTHDSLYWNQWRMTLLIQKPGVISRSASVIIAVSTLVPADMLCRMGRSR